MRKHLRPFSVGLTWPRNAAIADREPQVIERSSSSSSMRSRRAGISPKHGGPVKRTREDVRQTGRCCHSIRRSLHPLCTNRSPPVCEKPPGGKNRLTIRPGDDRFIPSLSILQHRFKTALMRCRRSAVFVQLLLCAVTTTTLAVWREERVVGVRLSAIHSTQQCKVLVR
jgi:hypothetical protein